jgi:amino acid transporter
MIRIFSTLALLSIALMVAAMVMGLSMGDLNARPAPTPETLQWATRHRLTGLAAALGVVFVQSIIVTYFIGTSRWCKEVVETYRLNPATAAESNRLKRKTFPWALGGMLAVVVVIALGGAADTTATLEADSSRWADWHLVAAFVGIIFVVWTYVIEWINIVAMYVVIEQTGSEVGRIRRERGLDQGGQSGVVATAIGQKTGHYSAKSR